MSALRRVRLAGLPALATAALVTAMAAVGMAVAAASLTAQAAPARHLFLVPKGDTVLVYVVDAPPALGGFVVYRGAPGTELQRVTAEAVEAVREPAMAAGMMGGDLPAVMTAVRATDASEMLRRLRSDAFAGPLMSLLYRSVAAALGRVWVDAGVPRGAELEYRVVFTDGAGRETDRSFTGRVTVRDVPPPAPSGLDVRPGDREVSLGWSFPSFRGDPADQTIGFHVYRADGASGGDFRRLTVVPVLRNEAAPLSYRDDEVATGGAYRYRVTAVDIAGRESVPTEARRVDVADRQPPAIPTGLAVQSGDGAVLLVWRMSPEPDVAGYQVERSQGLSEPYTRLTRALVPAGAPAFADSAVTGGRPYFYRVIAVDSAGNASEPSNALSALPVDETPPAPPGQVTASLTDDRRVLLTWAPSPSRDVLGYYVYRGEGTGPAARLTSKPVQGTQLADSGYAGGGLVPGRHYTVRVSAVDSSFNESGSVSVEIPVPDDEPPGAVTALSVRNHDGRWVEVAWSASASLDVREYVVTRDTEGSRPVEVGRYPASARSARDTAAAEGRRYTYGVVPVDSAGNAGPASTDSVTFGDMTPPPPPRRVTAVESADGGVVVTWERVASPDLAGYVVLRSDLPTGVFQRLTPEPAHDLTFRDATGAVGHFYEVRAVDVSGNLSAPSPAAGVVRP